jgi:hypothetical protein
MELCRDPPHHRIVEEVGQIQESVVCIFKNSQKLSKRAKISQNGRKMPKIPDFV